MQILKLHYLHANMFKQNSPFFILTNMATWGIHLATTDKYLVNKLLLYIVYKFKRKVTRTTIKN